MISIYYGAGTGRRLAAGSFTADRAQRMRHDLGGMIELTRDDIDALLHEQVVGRIGCHVDGRIYVVPIIYAYDGEAAYVASIEGTKIEMMRANPKVCFEVDEYVRGGGWRSAIVQGDYEELQGEEVAKALDLLQTRFGRAPSDSNRRLVSESTVVFRIVFREVTGRAATR